jgi:AraC-like DNA-binding protein
MFYKEYKPIEALSNHVKCIWVLENARYDDAVNVVFPDGCMELIFHFGPPFKRISNHQQQVQEKSILVGQLNKPLHLQATGSADIIGVRFHPWGLYPLVNMPLQHITNGEMPIRHIWGNDAHELEEKIYQLDKEAAMDEIQQFLFKQANHPSYQIEMLKKVITRLKGQQGNVKIDELAEMSNLSVRQFTRNFTLLVGLPPKVFAGIIRFQSFFSQCNQQPEVNLGELALQCGYYDQAHFIREFKQYAGMSPGAYFKNEEQLATLFLLK